VSAAAAQAQERVKTTAQRRRHGAFMVSPLRNLSPRRSGGRSNFWFPSSAWEHEAPKLCFVATTLKQNLTCLSRALTRSRASRRCVPKQSLGTRDCSPSPCIGGGRGRGWPKNRSVDKDKLIGIE